MVLPATRKRREQPLRKDPAASDASAAAGGMRMSERSRRNARRNARGRLEKTSPFASQLPPDMHQGSGPATAVLVTGPHSYSWDHLSTSKCRAACVRSPASGCAAAERSQKTPRLAAKATREAAVRTEQRPQGQGRRKPLAGGGQSSGGGDRRTTLDTVFLFAAALGRPPWEIWFVGSGLVLLLGVAAGRI